MRFGTIIEKETALTNEEASATGTERSISEHGDLGYLGKTEWTENLNSSCFTINTPIIIVIDLLRYAILTIMHQGQIERAYYLQCERVTQYLPTTSRKVIMFLSTN